MSSVAARNQPTYHRGNCKSQRKPELCPVKEFEKRRAAWRALPKISRRHGPKKKIGGQKKLTVLQSQIDGLTCDNRFRKCEWFQPMRRVPGKCKWYGDELETKHEVGVLRTKDCFVEEVPSKEEVENEQENKATD